jgi:sigma-B regulation protein RsbU (phosphoserine phosphatase)
MNAMKILVVDDEPDLEVLVRQKFRRQVREGRFDLVFARNGAEALEVLAQDASINIVLSDINMPVMDGLTLLGKLTDLDRILKAVIVSAYGDMQNIRIAMNRGAFDFVTKPIDFQDLEITINRTLDEILTLKRSLHDRAQLNALQQELSIAARIQQSILPRVFPAFPDRTEFDLFATMTPATEVGGDFYDFFLIDGPRLGFVIGDVSGKGVPAALFMAVCRTLLRATAMQVPSAGDCLQYVNKVLAADSSDSMFVTLFYGILNYQTGELEFAVGGHNPPYIFSESEVKPLCFEGGMIVGIRQGVAYKSERAQLLPGEGLFLFTDGLTESTNEAYDLFSEQRLEATLQRCAAQPLRNIVGSVTEEVRKFVADAPQSDDLTIVTLRYCG